MVRVSSQTEAPPNEVLEALVRHLIPLGTKTSITTSQTRVYCLGIAQMRVLMVRAPDTMWIPILETLSDPPPAVLARFASHAPPVRAMSACQRDSLRFNPDPPSLVSERATGARGARRRGSVSVPQNYPLQPSLLCAAPSAVLHAVEPDGVLRTTSLAS
jgi:hypothetical protein